MSERTTVLVIDDSPAIQNLVRSELIEQEVAIESAYDGMSGFALAQALKPDLVLLDVDMPGANGFEVCRQLQNNRSTSRIPIIFLTAASLSAEKVRGLEAGAIDYITKPFESDEFSARVRAALKRTGRRWQRHRQWHPPEPTRYVRLIEPDVPFN